MSARSRLPPLLESYIRLPPEASLVLLTGVIDAAPHWVTLRFLGHLLGQTNATPAAGKDDVASTREADDDQVTDGDTSIVLVSWMRDRDFWRAEARRGLGLDLARLESQGRFAFVDGLTSLYTPPSTEEKTAPRSTLPTRPTPSSRGPIPPRGSPAPQRATSATSKTVTNASSLEHDHTLTSPSLSTAFNTITKAISTLASTTRRTLLILDSPALLLATDPSISSDDLSFFITRLRATVHSTILVTEADRPLIAAAAPDAFLATPDYLSTLSKANAAQTLTPLDVQHAAFVVGQAHCARWVIGLRGLDTGAAKDVSGVLTVRRGGAWDEEGGTVEMQNGEREMEVLYRVGMDGSVKVFERGAGDLG